MDLDPVDPVIDCPECGGRAYLLSPPDPDEDVAPGAVFAYRCADCRDRFDLVVPDEEGPASGDDQAWTRKRPGPAW